MEFNKVWMYSNLDWGFLFLLGLFLILLKPSVHLWYKRHWGTAASVSCRGTCALPVRKNFKRFDGSSSPTPQEGGARQDVYLYISPKLFRIGNRRKLKCCLSQSFYHNMLDCSCTLVCLYDFIFITGCCYELQKNVFGNKTFHHRLANC